MLSVGFKVFEEVFPVFSRILSSFLLLNLTLLLLFFFSFGSFFYIFTAALIELLCSLFSAQRPLNQKTSVFSWSTDVEILCKR